MLGRAKGEINMAEPKQSVSQETPGAIDEGKESFTVDQTPEPVEGKTETDDSGEVIEEKGELEPEIEPEAEPKEEKIVPEPEDEGILPKGVQKRIDTITRKRREAEREADALRAENEALKSAAESRPDIGPEPNISDFETEGEYLKALSKFQVKEAVAEQNEERRKKDEETAKQRQEEIIKERYDDIQLALKSTSSKYPDFDEVIEGLKVTDPILQVMEKLPNLGEVAYMLGKKPTLIAEIAKMPIIEATLKLKEISDNLQSKKTTKSPTPIRPVSGTGGGIKSLEDMSFPEYRKVMEAREKERRGR